MEHETEPETAPDTEDGTGEQPDAPATWENVVVGKAKHLLGEAIRDEELAEQGEEQERVAHEVHDETAGDHPR